MFNPNWNKNHRETLRRIANNRIIIFIVNYLKLY